VVVDLGSSSGSGLFHAVAVAVGDDINGLLHHCDVININGPSYRLKDRLTLVAGGEPMT
jgi:hypothetical protein